MWLDEDENSDIAANYPELVCNLILGYGYEYRILSLVAAKDPDVSQAAPPR